MSVRCKYRCSEVTKREHWDKTKGFIYTAKFHPVTGGSAENEKFFASTPSGTLEIGTCREDQFEVGQDYYLDISPAPAA